MTMLTRRVVCGLLLPVLLVVASFEMPMASLRIAWRFMVLSFDNPVTQVLDDLVCETSPPSEAGADARHWARLAARVSTRVVSVAAPLRAGGHVRSSSVTRAPPAA